MLGSIQLVLVSTSCWQYQHDDLNQSWVNVVPNQSWVNVVLPCVTLATFSMAPNTTRKPNTGLMLGQVWPPARNEWDIQTERTHRHKLSGQTEQTKVNQHVPTSSEGRHNYKKVKPYFHFKVSKVFFCSRKKCYFVQCSSLNLTVSTTIVVVLWLNVIILHLFI